MIKYKQITRDPKREIAMKRERDDLFARVRMNTWVDSTTDWQTRLNSLIQFTPNKGEGAMIRHAKLNGKIAYTRGLK